MGGSKCIPTESDESCDKNAMSDRFQTVIINEFILLKVVKVIATNCGNSIEPE